MAKARAMTAPVSSPSLPLTLYNSPTRSAETLAERLDLPFRRVMIATGDLSFTACMKYDISCQTSKSLCQTLEIGVSIL